MGAIASSYLLEDQRLMMAAKNYFAWQAALVRPELGGRVLEVGCGIGNFTGSLLDREAVIATDCEPEYLVELTRRYPRQRNLIPVCCDATELRQLARYHPDTCVCLNVLEHVADDAGALAAMAGVLPRGGKIVLLLPAFPVLYGPIDRNLGHYRRYRRATILKLAADAGLKVEKLRYANLPGFFGWWLNSHVLKRQEQSSLQIRFFDRYILPVVARLERFSSPPFGQSLFAVLAKK